MISKVLTVGLLALLLAGCSVAPPPSVAVRSPVDTAQAWFKSINDHDMALAAAHFTPTTRAMMQWNDFGSVSFSHVRCSPQSRSERTASVTCTFTPHAPAGDQLLADRFWTVYMRRQPPGPWLIYDYERVDRDLWAPAAAAAGSLAHP